METLRLTPTLPPPPVSPRMPTSLDFACFDPAADPKGWFLAEHLIERAAGEPLVVDRLFAHYGLHGWEHFREVQAAVTRFLASPMALARFGDPDAIARLRGSALMDAPAPVPLEQYIEITEAQRAAAQRGLDVREVLVSFALDDAEWNRVRFWWLERLTRSVDAGEGELHARFARLQAHFRAKYGMAS